MGQNGTNPFFQNFLTIPFFWWGLGPIVLLIDYTELQKRADRADQSVLFFLAGANFWGKTREKLLIFGKSTRKTANFWEKHAKNC